MSKNLAIKGHSTRGEEVIELLKMLGGDCKNAYDYTGCLDCYYYITEFGRIESAYKLYEFDNFIVYTLDEFWKKYPFKVGDKVNTVYGGCDGTIKEMKWVDNEVKYRLDFGHLTGEWYSANELQSIKEKENMEEKKINQMSLANCDLDEVEIVLGDKFELKIEDGKYYAVRKKSKYPTTYDECCKILGCKANHFFTDFSYNGLNIEISNYENKIDDLLQNFRKLRYCRDAYWKIAGEELGLGKPWEPDWSNDDETKFCIYTTQNIISLDIFGVDNRILAFPTEEMRDAFFENFKDLIEKCKELL